MKRQNFWPALLALTLLAPASAQLWENPRTTAAQPVLSGFSGSGDVLSKGKARIEFDRVGQRVVGVYVTAPKNDTDAVARGILSAWGAPEGAVTELKGVLNNADFQAQASQGVFTEVDSSGQTEVNIRLKGDTWHAYNALKVFPTEAFGQASEPLGNKAAPARIDIVSDYQCPYCKRLWDSEAMRVWRSKGSVYAIHYHHFPLQMHPNALPAAAYAECAAESGKMWAFSDLVYARFGEWNSLSVDKAMEKFAAFAREAGVSGDLGACVKKEQGAVTENLERLVQSLDVGGTPSVYVNGIKLTDYNNPREVREVRAVTEGSSGQDAGAIIRKRLSSLR